MNVVSISGLLCRLLILPIRLAQPAFAARLAFACLLGWCSLAQAQSLRAEAQLNVMASASQPVAAPVRPSQGVQALPQITLDSLQNEIALDTLSEYWIDETGKASIHEVDAAYGSPAVFRPRQNAQRHQIHDKALWIRFDARITDTRARWFVDVALASTDHVSLFWRDAQGQWVTLRSGDLLARSQWAVQDRFPVFQLDPQRQANTPYYLRIEHARMPFSAPLHIYRDTALVAQRSMEQFFLGAYFGLVMLVALVCVALALAQRERSYVHYIAYVLLVGISQATVTGMAGQYLWPQMPQWASLSYFFFASIATAAGMWFVRAVAKPRVYMPRLDKVALVVIAALVLVAFVDLARPSLAGFHISNLLVISVVVMVYVVAWYGWTRGDAVVRWIALGFLPVILGIVPLLLRNLGLIDSSFLTQHGVTVGSAIEMPILLYGLVLRTSARREARVRTAGLPTHDAMTGLSNTYDLLRHIHGSMTRAARYRQHYGLVLIELVNHAWFVKEHSKEIGDRALMLLATRLQLIARDVDTAGRVDENHFVLLIEGPCKPADVVKVAAQIAASVRRPSDLLPIGAQIKLQITCALMPDADALQLGDDANAQLGWLLHSSAMLDPVPGRNIRTLNF